MLGIVLVLPSQREERPLARLLAALLLLTPGSLNGIPLSDITLPPVARRSLSLEHIPVAAHVPSSLLDLIS